MATRDLNNWTTIWGTAGTLSDIDQITIATITSATFRVTTNTTSVIITNSNDTGEVVSNFTNKMHKSTSRMSNNNTNNNNNGTNTNNNSFIEIELAEWVGFDKYNDDYWLSLMTGKIK